MTIQGQTTQRPGTLLAASIVLVLSSVYLFKISVLDVLAAARRHAPSVSFGNGSFVAPILLVLGLVSLTSSIAPGSFSRGAVARFMSNPATGRISGRGIVVVLAVLCLGFALHLWLRTQLRELGYAV